MKNSTTKSCSPSLQKKMLLQCPLDGEKIQLLLQDKHPNSEIFGYMSCPVCHNHLHGHGWRTRFCQDSSRSCYKIWIHRKYCPQCKNTFTLLQKILHALKMYTLQTILNVLSFKVTFGHFTTTIEVPASLQRVWYRQFVKRSRLKTDFPDLREGIKQSQVIASPLTLHQIKDSVNMAVFQNSIGKSHHRLNFYSPP